MQHTMMKREKMKIYVSPRRTENVAIHSTLQLTVVLSSPSMSSMSQLMMVQEAKRVRYIFFVKSDDCTQVYSEKQDVKIYNGRSVKIFRSKNKNGCCNREITGNWRNVPKGNFAGNRD